MPHLFYLFLYLILRLPWWLSGKESTCNVGDEGDVGSIPGSERSPGGGHENPLQCSCLENPMDRGAYRAAVYGVAKSQIRLSDWAGNESVTGRKARGPKHQEEINCKWQTFFLVCLFFISS